jgi:hypothetical protein
LLEGDTDRQIRLSRTFDDGAHANSASIIAVSADLGAWTTLALSNTNPALPYICRLIVLIAAT